MANSKTIKTAAQTSDLSAGLLRPSTLILAAVIALEAAGLRALSPTDTAPSFVASIDGTAADAPTAPARKLRAASVEIRVVAQADTPAR